MKRCRKALQRIYFLEGSAYRCEDERLAAVGAVMSECGCTRNEVLYSARWEWERSARVYAPVSMNDLSYSHIEQHMQHTCGAATTEYIGRSFAQAIKA